MLKTSGGLVVHDITLPKGSICLKPIVPSKFVIGNSPERRAEINLETGEVMLVGMTPDDAAKDFWEAVKRNFPR